MRNHIKGYADTLFERSLFESTQALSKARTDFAHEMASRRMTTYLPISGPEIQSLMRLFAQHVERCMEARFESYDTAYKEANEVPVNAEFNEIWTSVQLVWKAQSQHSAGAIGEFARTRGNTLNLSFDVLPMTAHAHDRILRNLKVWQAKINLAKSVSPNDQKFARVALEEAKRSVSEDDGRIHPLVGVVVVRNGEVIATAHRGEFRAEHAEYIALERKLGQQSVVGTTIYTTLEPCTVRKDPKVPCAERLAERRVERVVIGMLDPNPDIQGDGQKRLRDAKIVTDFFPSKIMNEVEELNRHFARQFRMSGGPGTLPSTAVEPKLADAVQSTEPTVKWVSLGYEHKSGLSRALNDQGYELGWVSADREAEKVELEAWEYVVLDNSDGRKAHLKMRDHPAIGGYLVLLKKRR